MLVFLSNTAQERRKEGRKEGRGNSQGRFPCSYTVTNCSIQQGPVFVWFGGFGVLLGIAAFRVMRNRGGLFRVYSRVQGSGRFELFIRFSIWGWGHALNPKP